MRVSSLINWARVHCVLGARKVDVKKVVHVRGNDFL